jgi:hypothetical protein
MLQNITLWVAGFVVSVIGLLQVTNEKFDDPSKILVNVGRYAVQSTEVVAGGVLAMIFVTIMLNSETSLNPRKNRLVFSLVRLVSAWPKWLSGTFFVAISAALFVAVYQLSQLI